MKNFLILTISSTVCLFAFEIQKFGGIGITLGQSADGILVKSVLEDSPASDVGIKSGDLIVYIEGESAQGLSVADAVEKMRGESGVPLEISIQVQEQLVHFDLIRVRMEIHMEKSKNLQGLSNEDIRHALSVDMSAQLYHNNQAIANDGIADLSGHVFSVQIARDQKKLHSYYQVNEYKVFDIQGRMLISTPNFKQALELHHNTPKSAIVKP
jgi:hypothetical protein